MKDFRTKWLAAWGYVLFIYATLGVAGIPFKYLRQHNMLRISLFLGWFVTLALLVGILVRRGLRELWRQGALVLIFASFILIGRHVATPEEQLHFFEYGLVGVLFALALQDDRTFSIKQIVGALILAGAAGWVDEIIQGFIPSRHYDLHDVGLNVVSAGLGLVIYSLFQIRPRSRNSSIQV